MIAEEKVDGANLGFSLTADYAVECQNRAHYVCSATSAQFKGLDAWLEEHPANPNPNPNPNSNPNPNPYPQP